MPIDDDVGVLVRQTLSGFGASGDVLDALLAYTANPFDTARLDVSGAPARRRTADRGVGGLRARVAARRRAAGARAAPRAAAVSDRGGDQPDRRLPGGHAGAACFPPATVRR